MSEDLDLPPYQPTSIDNSGDNQEKHGKENTATILGALASIVVGGGVAAISGITSGLPVGVFLLVIVAAIRIVVYLIQFSIDKLTQEVDRQGGINTGLRGQLEHTSEDFDLKIKKCEDRCEEIKEEMEAELRQMRAVILNRNRVILRLALAVKELGADIDPSKFVFGVDDNEENYKNGHNESEAKLLKGRT